MRDTFLEFSPPTIGDAEIAAVTDVLRSSWISSGPKVREFEQSFADYFGIPGAVAVNSCTDALQIGLAATGIGPGDAVFTTTMTFCATAHVVEHLGATPVLVDIDPVTLNIDPAELARAVKETKSTGDLAPRAVIPVHHSGQPCDMPAIFEVAREHDLFVLEDAAHALPAAWSGHRVGGPVDAGVRHAVAFSFYATKNLTTAEGGMLTGDADILEEARLWALHGMSRDAWKRYGKGGSWFYEVVRPGFKANMTDIQAALGLVQLQRLAGFHHRRQAISARYHAGLAGESAIETPGCQPDVEHAWHLYVMRLNLDQLTIDRSRFIDELAARNIASSVHFIPLHLHPFYRDKYALRPEDFPVASAEYERLVSLPLYPTLTDTDVDDVIEAVLDVVSQHRR